MDDIKKYCRTPIIDLVGKLKLEETVGIMKKMKLFVCTNGGLMWISAALGLPTVVVSGPTPYWWDTNTSNSITIRNTGRAFYHQDKYSWTQHARTDDISVKDVVSAIKKLWGNYEKNRHNNL